MEPIAVSFDDRWVSHATHPVEDQVGDPASDHDDGSFLFDPHPDDEHADEHAPEVLGHDLAPYPADVAVGTGRHSHRGPSAGTATLLKPPPRRGAEKELRRKRRRRRTLLVLVLVVLLVIAGAGWVGYQTFKPTKVADWTGAGTGAVTIQVHPGDGAGRYRGHAGQGRRGRVGRCLHPGGGQEQPSRPTSRPGRYQLRPHMSGAAAVNLMLDPAAHLVAKLVIPEGTIEKDVITKLAAALKMSDASVSAAASNIANLGMPDGYAPASGPLTSAEGFLYPDTYASTRLYPGRGAAADDLGVHHRRSRDRVRRRRQEARADARTKS